MERLRKLSLRISGEVAILHMQTFHAAVEPFSLRANATKSGMPQENSGDVLPGPPASCKIELMAQTVLLIDDTGRITKEVNRAEAHDGIGLLHAAFSVYIFRDGRKEFLMQKRGKDKLWAGIWANTCCSHLRRGETPREAGERRLLEEMGFTCLLREEGTFVYRAEDPEGKGVEHERVMLLTGDLDEQIVPRPDPAEIAEWKWVAVPELRKDMEAYPGLYAPWFRIGLRRICGGG